MSQSRYRSNTEWSNRKTMKVTNKYLSSPGTGGGSEVCNNCGKSGHSFKQCKNPITSFGVIIFRMNPSGYREYLMIRRKDTLGYIDFMRGKYSICSSAPASLRNIETPTTSSTFQIEKYKYILNMFKQMTQEEKVRLLTKTFDELWNELWGSEDASSQSLQPPPPPYYETFRQEEINSREKFQYLNTTRIQDTSSATILQSIIMQSQIENLWDEPEWGFPKGRRNYQERDYECALREMTEETGYPISAVMNIKNILPFEEYFIGSNYKSYKHKYYLMYMDYDVSMQYTKTDKTEVSSMKWKTFEECMESIRPYNAEKKRLITNIENALSRMKMA